MAFNNPTNTHHEISSLNPSNTTISHSEIQSEFSHHDPHIARINNGSLGCCPATVIAAQHLWQRLFLRQPDLFYFFHLQPAINISRQLLLPLINAPSLDSISLVDNTTTSTAIVLQYISRFFHDPSDAAIMFQCAYPAVKKSMHAYISRVGGHIIQVPLPFPVYNPDDIISQFKNSLQNAKLEKRRVRLAVIDHITSMPTMLLPIKDLIKICREEGVDHVFVDGAHAIGSIKVDLCDIGADFYTSNLNKWLFCPPSVAFLYCNKTNELDEIHHPIVSHEYGNGLAAESSWVGTRDYSPQLVVPKVMEFVNRFDGGLEGIMKRNHEKVVEMGKMLVKAWGTHLGCSPEMCASMIMVGLPSCLGIKSDEDARKLRTLIREKFGVEVPLYYRKPKDGEVDCLTGYARISHQVYNTVDDYYKFRDAINKLVEDGFTCQLLQG